MLELDGVLYATAECLPALAIFRLLSCASLETGIVRFTLHFHPGVAGLFCTTVLNNLLNRVQQLPHFQWLNMSHHCFTFSKTEGYTYAWKVVCALDVQRVAQISLLSSSPSNIVLTNFPGQRTCMGLEDWSACWNTAPKKIIKSNKYVI